MENPKCPICSSEDINIRYKNAIGNKNMAECKKCLIQYLNPYPFKEELNEIYSDSYAAWGLDKGDAFSKMKRDKFKRLLKDVNKYCDSGKFLDIGCGPGYLMEEAEKIGFDVYGIEIGKKAYDIAKEKFGDDKVLNCALEESNLKNNFFDVIAMSDILEHVLNPFELLKKSNDILNNTTNSNGGGI